MCADGRSCEFFLMCWMTAGLLDGSCGGIMYACCQRKDPKALTDYNLIESPRDQSRPLPLDLYTETASDDRKSFLRKACHPYSSTALGSMRSIITSLLFLFFLSSSSNFLSIVFFSSSNNSQCHTFACIPSIPTSFSSSSSSLHRLSRKIASFPHRMPSIYHLESLLFF